MDYKHLVCVIAVGVWPAVTGAMQMPAGANPLPTPLRSHVNDDRFQVVTSVRGLPLGVREELQTLFQSPTLDIAEPGAEFRATAVNSPATLPSRRLVTAACSIDHCIVYYERGGNPRTWYITLFHWTRAATRFEWGGIATGDLKTIDDLRTAVLSGAIKQAGSW
jgi:hypothetical protein